MPWTADVTEGLCAYLYQAAGNICHVFMSQQSLKKNTDEQGLVVFIQSVLLSEPCISDSSIRLEAGQACHHLSLDTLAILSGLLDVAWQVQ